jgi:hypothetical protein
LGWDWLNLVSSIGGFMFATGVGVTFVNLWVSRKHPRDAGPNPWDADTLEWATESPTPEWNFAAVPIVASRHPLWDQPELPVAQSNGDAASKSLGPEGALHHQTPETTGLDARPQGPLDLPHPTYLPFILACGIAIFFVGLMIKAELVGAVGVAFAVVGLTWWAWRTEADLA